MPPPPLELDGVSVLTFSTIETSPARARAVPVALLWTMAAVVPIVGLLALALWRVPYPISETVAILEDLDQKPLRELLIGSAVYFRPGFWLMLYSIWHAAASPAEALFFFKILHITTAVGLLALFVAAVAPTTFTEAAGALAAFAVLVAAPGFRDNLENLPLNHMLLEMGIALAIFLLIQGIEERRWRDGVAIVLSAIALSLREHGLIAIAMIAVARPLGYRGVGRIATAVVVSLGGLYLGYRLAGMSQWPVFMRNVGVGFGELSEHDAMLRFGSFPATQYLYNVAATAGNVLFGEPSRGVFVIVRNIVAGRTVFWQWNQLLSSAAMTCLIACWAVASLRGESAGGRDRRLACLTAVVIILGSLLGYNYTRDRFGGVLAVFYALCAGRAVLWLIERGLAGSAWRAFAVSAGLCVLLSAWELRVAGTIQFVRQNAWESRKEWIMDYQDRATRFSNRPHYVQLLDALHAQGTNATIPDTQRDPQWVERFLGNRW